MSEKTYYPRFLRPRIEEALSDSPVVLIHGPRQCGKTTLARLVGDDAVAGFGDKLYAVPISRLWEGD